MRKSLRRLLRRIVEPWRASAEFSQLSYAQEGEDLLLQRLLIDRPVLPHESCVYVDVGAHHPFRYSNTYFFYRKGWSGICIDPMPGIRELFAKWRPRDRFLELGIAGESSVAPYYMFNDGAFNTFDANHARECVERKLATLIETRDVPVEPLRDVLKRELPVNASIMILSVDVEGYDLDVLQSNNWEKFRPRYVIAECLKTNVSNLQNDPVVQFLATQEFECQAKLHNSVLFIDRNA